MTINFPDDRLKVHGLPWFGEDKPIVRRLPERLKGTFRQPVWGLAQHPAGGRIRFRTDSRHVSIRAKSPDYYVMNHITRIGQSGFDIYVDGYFQGSVSPDDKGVISADWAIAPPKGRKKLRNCEISMPLYKPVTIESIGIDDDASITDPAPFALPKPVVYYGTSITQGGCASTPGTTYQSFISRWTNTDFVNLGFSCNGDQRDRRLLLRDRFLGECGRGGLWREAARLCGPDSGEPSQDADHRRQPVFLREGRDR